MPVRPDATRLRLMVRIARMYHELGMRQTDIATELHVSQPRVSRLLKRAVDEGIVRTVVNAPEGTYTVLEEQMEQRYGLSECIIVDSGTQEAEVGAALASAAATYMETTLTGGDVIGLSSWSATWLAAVEQLSAFRVPVAQQVIQLFGGVGHPHVQVKATRLIDMLARATGAEAVFFPSPAILGSASAAEQLADDPAVQRVMELLPQVTIALMGIGSVEPSPLLRESGNMTTAEDARELSAAGAVGDVCLRFFDADGAAVKSSYDARLVGVDADQIRAIPRRVAAAGGERKHAAIRGAVLGGWVNVLLTDIHTARALLED